MNSFGLLNLTNRKLSPDDLNDSKIIVKADNAYDSDSGSSFTSAGSEEIDDAEDDSLRKIEDNIQKDIILLEHPELKKINYDELNALSTIIRDKSGKIIDKLHKTLPFLTKYEKTRILGIRCKQINEGSQLFINVNNKMIDGYNIALQELFAKKIPFIIQRPLPHGVCEYWKVSDLELI